MVDSQSQPHAGPSAANPPTAGPSAANLPADGSSAANSPTAGPSAANLHRRWRRGCTPADLPDEDIEEFTKWKLEKYKASTRTGPGLSEAFAEDFQLFTKDTFGQCEPEILRDLRDLLRSRGVYVRMGRGISIAKELANVVQNDIPWPEDDHQRPVTRSPVGACSHLTTVSTNGDDCPTSSTTTSRRIRPDPQPHECTRSDPARPTSAPRPDAAPSIPGAPAPAQQSN